MGRYTRVEHGTRVELDVAPDLSGPKKRFTIEPSMWCHKGCFIGLGSEFAHLTEQNLDDLIADLQRLKSGCFAGEWPKPEPLGFVGRIDFGDFSPYIVHEPKKPEAQYQTRRELIAQLLEGDLDATVSFSLNDD